MGGLSSIPDSVKKLNEGDVTGNAEKIKELGFQKFKENIARQLLNRVVHKLSSGNKDETAIKEILNETNLSKAIEKIITEIQSITNKTTEIQSNTNKPPGIQSNTDHYMNQINQRILNIDYTKNMMLY